MTVPATEPAVLPRPELTAESPQVAGMSPSPRLSAVPDHGIERRGSGRRARARDRLMDRATQPHSTNTAVFGVDGVENLLLFVDDDLRETALALHHIEAFLLRTLGLLEAEKLRRVDVHEVAADTSVLDHVDVLNETLESLRRRLARLAARMR